MNVNDLQRARRLLEQSLALAREVGDNDSITYCLHNCGDIARYAGDYEAAHRLLEESIEVSQRLGHQRLVAGSIAILGSVAYQQGNDANAIEHFQYSLGVFHELGERHYIPNCFEGLAAVYIRQGQSVRSARLFGAAEALREVIDMPLIPIERPDYERNVATLRSQLEPAAFAALWHTGRAWSLEEALAYALQAMDTPG